MSVPLYHASEEGGISHFAPRVGRTGEPLVWAVGEPHLHNYLLPRDCPRASFWAGPDSPPQAVERLLGATLATYVLAVEKGWLDRIRRTRLYLYEMPGDTFAQLEEGVHYYTSRQAVTPSGVRAVDDLLGALAARDVELRFVDSLWRVHHAAVDSGLQFSGIRLRNAAVPAADAWIAERYMGKPS